MRNARPVGQKSSAKHALLAGAALGSFAILAASSAQATPTYSLLTTIAIPAARSNTAGTFVGYDLSTFDATNQLYYLTDRSNNGVDVFSAKTNSYIERIGQGTFSGATASNDNAGPNGISITTIPTGRLLIAGDGPSSFQTFNLDATGLNLVAGTTPRTTSTAVAGTPSPPNRVDGVAYAPGPNTILSANNASTPGFVTLVNNADGTIIKSIKLDGTGGYPNVAGDGVEATVYNTARKTFFVAIPRFNSAGAGGVIELNASTGALVNTFDFNALGLTGICGPTGVAQGATSSVLVACGDNAAGPKQTVLLNPDTNSIKIITGVGGGDQVAYNPTLDTFFEAARFNPGGPVLGIIGGDGTFSQNISITFNDHSVAVDPVSGEVFVAFGASTQTNPDPYCAAGCIGVFAPAPVPEPATLPLMTAGLLSLALMLRHKKRPS